MCATDTPLGIALRNIRIQSASFEFIKWFSILQLICMQSVTFCQRKSPLKSYFYPISSVWHICIFLSLGNHYSYTFRNNFRLHAQYFQIYTMYVFTFAGLNKSTALRSLKMALFGEDFVCKTYKYKRQGLSYCPFIGGDSVLLNHCLLIFLP